MITENLSTLKIHKLTQEQYERELAAGNIDVNALYLTPDEEIDLSPYATKAEVEELKISVSEGKALIAEAVTDKGVLTASDAAFATIAANIENIQVGVDTSDATATASDLPKGVTAYANGEKITGNVETFNEGETGSLFFCTPQYFEAAKIINGVYVFNEYDGDRLYRTGSIVKAAMNAQDFGNATAEDVAAGKTFTSAAGLKVVGTGSSNSSSSMNLKHGYIEIDTSETSGGEIVETPRPVLRIQLPNEVANPKLLMVSAAGKSYSSASCTNSTVIGNFSTSGVMNNCDDTNASFLFTGVRTYTYTASDGDFNNYLKEGDDLTLYNSELNCIEFWIGVSGDADDLLGVKGDFHYWYL